jgi:hypothetical protein
MVTNLAYFFETSKKVRGGKWVWVKDSNGENRNNILLGGTLANPSKGFGHIWAAQLLQYTPGQPMYIFRSFMVAADAANNATTIYVNGDGYSDVPEVGMLLMVAPDALTVETLEANTETGAVTKTVADATGQSAKVTAVSFDATNKRFEVTLAATLGSALTGGTTILVEANGTSASASAKPLVPNPNVFNEADRDLMPTEGFGIQNANYSISGVYNKQAWIARMQPLPKYVLAKNKSLIDGIFWI